LNTFIFLHLKTSNEQKGIISILNIADQDIVQIHTSSHFSFRIINHIIAVKNSGKELDIASKVAPLTLVGIFNFFHKISSSASSFQQA